MGIFKLSRETTKCRVVFLSNLCERMSNSNADSHNQAILPGPCLNHNITTSVVLLRFDKFLITFDLMKAFLTFKLRESGQNRLMFLWYNNVNADDYTIVGFRSLRLSFGLRCSPTILVLGLYKLLILDEVDDRYVSDLKQAIYNTIYMDNGSYSCNDAESLRRAYATLTDIFSPYCFGLQQFSTNLSPLQGEIDCTNDLVTPTEVKLFGMNWNRENDTFSPYKLSLNYNANTKRSVLQTLNSVYDVYDLYAPLILRAKLFMQRLQCDSSFGWDSVMSDDVP